MTFQPLHIAACLLVVASCCQQGVATAEPPIANRPVPTGIAALLATAPDAIERRDPTTVRGIVTFRFECKFLAIQDDSAGMWIRFEPSRPHLMKFLESVSPGDLVEIVGILDPGAFAPTLIAIDLVTCGAGPLPVAMPVDPNRLFGGADNGRRVILPGVVQGYREAGAWWHLVVDSAGHRLVAQVAKASLERDPAELVDAEVQLTGVAGSIRNTRGEFLLPRLCIARSADVEVVTPRHAEAFETPRVSLSAIAGYRAEPSPGHRVQTSGVVTLAIPGHFFYLQQGLEGVRVETASTEPLVAGDVVDVSGFIRMRHGLGTLTESVFRVSNRTQPPKPMDLQPAEMLAVNLRAHKRGMTARPASYHGCLVRCVGTLLEVRPPESDRCRLLVAADDVVVTAELPATEHAALEALPPGSRLALTGIAELGLDHDQQLLLFGSPLPDHVDLLLGSKADIEVLQIPSWWTPRRLVAALVAAVAAVAAAGLWVGILRVQVARQATVLAAELEKRHRAEVEHDAALRERSRLAANLHDTVLQTVTGVGFQLKVCQTLADRSATGLPASQPAEAQPPSAPGSLDLARRMVDHAIQQLRGTVWALHTIPTSDEPFGRALESLAMRLLDGHAVQLRMHAEDADLASHSLPDVIAGTLLLVVQEAVINALRHARAHVIDVTAVLSHGDETAITVSIHDDGVGFEPGLQPGAMQGHFGLEAMRDRLERVEGTLLLESRVGGGTTITARVPLPAAGGLSESPMARDRDAASMEA